jgi:hypothetical protein
MANNELRALPAGGRDPETPPPSAPLTATEHARLAYLDDLYDHGCMALDQRTEWETLRLRLKAPTESSAGTPAAGGPTREPSRGEQALAIGKHALEADGYRVSPPAPAPAPTEVWGCTTLNDSPDFPTGAPAGGDTTRQQGEPDLEYGYTKLREALFECAKLGVLLDSIVGRDIAQIAYGALTDYPAPEDRRAS